MESSKDNPEEVTSQQAQAHGVLIMTRPEYGGNIRIAITRPQTFEIGPGELAAYSDLPPMIALFMAELLINNARRMLFGFLPHEQPPQQT